MCDPFERQKSMVEVASGIIAAGRGSIKIVQGMTLAGFTTPERQNMKLYQQVRRRSMKLDVVKRGKKAAPHSITVNKSNVSNVSSLTIASHNEKIAAAEFIQSSPEQDGATAGRVLMITDDSSGSTALLTAGRAVTKKKTRATSKQVRVKHSIKAAQVYRDKLAMKQATVLIARNQRLAHGDPAKRTIVEILDDTNAKMKANVSHKTAAQYVHNGMIGVSPLKRGPIQQFEKRVWDALKGAYVTYLKLFLELGDSGARPCSLALSE
jgi:hypothetical protein